MLRANQPGCLDNSSVGGTTSYACIPPQLGLVTQPNYGACLNWRLAPPRIVDRISSAGFWPMPAMVKNVLRCSVVSPSTNVPFLEIGQSVNQRTHEPFFNRHCLQCQSYSALARLRIGMRTQLAMPDPHGHLAMCV